MNDINEIGVDGQEVETKDINNEYIIHRYMTENESNTNRDTLKKLMEECLDDQDDEVKEKIADNENEGVINRDITEK